ncbi:hypothetical protein M2132_000175 [Dysgonomonas sp. PH5-45]|nr:hypothetical protein [Dysgonomonas sp. PH5-45]MDH6386760.1 hypothetical protein [Dysgonomonas sp. PH5-37]
MKVTKKYLMCEFWQQININHKYIKTSIRIYVSFT